MKALPCLNTTHVNREPLYQIEFHEWVPGYDARFQCGQRNDTDILEVFSVITSLLVRIVHPLRKSTL